jgi:hypothetical protein
MEPFDSAFILIAIVVYILLMAVAIHYRICIQRSLAEREKMITAILAAQQAAIQQQQLLALLSNLQQQGSHEAQMDGPPAQSQNQIDPQMQQKLDQIMQHARSIAQQGHENFLLGLGNIR